MEPRAPRCASPTPGGDVMCTELPEDAFMMMSVGPMSLRIADFRQMLNSGTAGSSNSYPPTPPKVEVGGDRSTGNSFRAIRPSPSKSAALFAAVSEGDLDGVLEALGCGASDSAGARRSRLSSSRRADGRRRRAASPRAPALFRRDPSSGPVPKFLASRN